MKKTILLFGVFLTSFAFAQVSISSNSTDTPEATLDVKAMKSTTSPDGILIPRLTRAETLAMNGTIKEATMIYVTDNNTTAGTGTVVDVDTKGFYYFDAAATPAPGKWVKVGGGISNLSEVEIGIKHVVSVSPADFTPGVNAVAFTGGLSHVIPNPTNFTGKTIVLINKSGGNVTVAVDGGSSIVDGAGVRRHTSLILVSDGTTWYRLSS